MALKVDLATANITLEWNLDTSKPVLDVDVNVAETNPFPLPIVLSALAGALRSAADQLENDPAIKTAQPVSDAEVGLAEWSDNPDEEPHP